MTSDVSVGEIIFWSVTEKIACHWEIYWLSVFTDPLNATEKSIDYQWSLMWDTIASSSRYCRRWRSRMQVKIAVKFLFVLSKISQSGSIIKFINDQWRNRVSRSLKFVFKCMNWSNLTLRKHLCSFKFRITFDLIIEWIICEAKLFVLNGILWEMGWLHCGICEIGLGEGNTATATMTSDAMRTPSEPTATEVLPKELVKSGRSEIRV